MFSTVLKPARGEGEGSEADGLEMRLAYVNIRSFALTFRVLLHRPRDTKLLKPRIQMHLNTLMRPPIPPLEFIRVLLPHSRRGTEFVQVG